MRACVSAVLLLWQLGSAAAPSPSHHLRYEREIEFAGHTPAQVCFALDANVLGHTESAGGGDIRIFGRDQQREFAVPFALTESGPVTVEAQPATIRKVAVRAGALAFDVSMPAGDYTDVVLDVKAKSFVGAAEVTGLDAAGRATPIGTFAVFDLTAQGLARSTLLSLPESSYPTLHVELRLFTPDGQPFPIEPSLIAGATVPPSRERQTVYTTIASTSMIEQQGHWSTATMVVPAHVPIERARFVLRPDFHQDFLRNATIAATPTVKGWEATGAAEGVSGNIFRVARAATTSVPAIDAAALTINTIIGANLRSAAKVTATIENGASAPLPIERVDLEMRERRLCFEAHRGVSYTLRYGDTELSAPSYSYAHRFAASANPIVAELGPEQTNPNYVRAGSGDEKRYPEHDLPWVLLIAAVSVAGVIGLQYVRYKRESLG